MGKLNEEHGAYPAHTRHDEELDSYIWCFCNGITIGPTPLWKENYGKWAVHVTMNEKRNVDPAIYEKEEVMDKVYEYCDYYYNKYKKNE